MLKNRSKDDWHEVYIPIQICSVDVPVREFCNKFGLDFFEYSVDGLGPIAASVFEIDGILIWLSGPDCNNFGCDVLFEVVSYEPDTCLALHKICEKFRLELSDLYWINDSLGKAEWLLSRYDDNGNDITMFTFHSESAANAVKTRYESKGHKQAYFVSKL